MRTQGNLKLCCKVLADAWSHWGKTSNLVRSCIPSKRDENTGQSLILSPLGQNLQLSFSRAVRCLILSDKEVNLGHSATINVRRLVRRPSAIPSNTHFRFSQSPIHKNRRESKQPTAFSNNLQMESGSCLIMQLPIRSRYLKCFKLPMELGNTSKDELLRSSTRKYLNLAIHTSNDKLLHQG
nr:hypothetical protein CFP56_18814 [Quercus suber]